MSFLCLCCAVSGCEKRDHPLWLNVLYISALNDSSSLRGVLGGYPIVRWENSRIWCAVEDIHHQEPQYSWHQACRLWVLCHPRKLPFAIEIVWLWCVWSQVENAVNTSGAGDPHLFCSVMYAHVAVTWTQVSLHQQHIQFNSFEVDFKWSHKTRMLLQDSGIRQCLSWFVEKCVSTGKA